MPYYHAVMIDETGCEFGAGENARDKHHAAEVFKYNYPESRVVQIESAEDTAAREALIYADALAGINYDDDGRPIYPPGYEDDYEDEDDYYEDEEE